MCGLAGAPPLHRIQGEGTSLALLVFSLMCISPSARNPLSYGIPLPYQVIEFIFIKHTKFHLISKPANKIRIVALAFIVNECTGFNISHHRRAHRHERSRHRRQYRDEYGHPFVLVGGEGSESGPWSEWSEAAPCSRSCGGGVTYQERRCNVETACTGAPKRYFSCNIEDCPEGSLDFRAEQCAAYNNVEFEGQTYDWIPYTKAENKCQLNCMPRGERFYYRHEEKVHDGTLCREDSLDVCVDGECMPVGCDKLLGSTTKEDPCRVCGGDGSTCTTTTGILENDDLIVGYNDLLLIPEGATRIRISERRPSSNYLAIRNRTGHYYLNGNWRIDYPKSLRFAGTVFTYSRKPFGFWAPESITALGPTNEAIFIVLLYQEKNPGIEYEYSVPKGTVHETSPQGYGWQFGEWSPCNTTCGSGYQYREVWCAHRKASSRASSDLCDPTTEPTSYQTCSLTACPPTWTAGPWSPCSVTCGAKGTQTRQVYCTQDDGSGRPTLYEDDNACASAGAKPETTQSCEGSSVCPSLHIGPWKPCDRLCGDGKQKRDIQCYHKVDDKIEVLPLSLCGDQVPESEKICNLRPCEGVDWITSEWTGCEDKCGLAIETRTTYCGNKDGRPYPDSLCHEYRKPQLVRNCTYTPCASQWYTSQWSACSAKCGTGIQTRAVFCAAFEGDLLKKVDDSNCDPEIKYTDKQECKAEEECKGEWFFGPYSSCSKPCGGGIMVRKVLCIKENKTVGPDECPKETTAASLTECNKHACGEDEIIPVEPTQIISEEYSEECEEGDYYDYEDVTDDSFIKVSTTLDSSSSDDLSITGKEMKEITGFTDEEGSGGFSDDLITVRSTQLEINATSEATESSSYASSSDISSLAPELSSPLASSVSPQEGSESTTLTSLLSSLLTEISSSSLFASTTLSSVSDSSSSSVDVSSVASSIGFQDSSASSTASGASSESPLDLPQSDSTSSSVDSSSSDISSEKSTALSDSSSPLSDKSTSGSASESTTLGSTDSSTESSTDSSDITSSEPPTETTSTDLTSSETTLSSSDSDSSSTPDSISTTLEASESESTTISSSASSLESSTISSASSDSSETGVTESFTTSSETSSEVSSSSVAMSSGSSTISEGAESSTLPASGTSGSISSTESIISSSQSSSSDISTGTTESASSDAISSTVSSVEGSTTLSSSSSEDKTSSGSPSSTESSASQLSEGSSSAATLLSSSSSDADITDEKLEETSEIEKTYYTEAIFNFTTPSNIEKAIKKEQKRKKCRRRPKKSKCVSSEFGCCPDNKTPAQGPFGKDCPIPKTCKESEFGCCLDEVSPAQGPNNKGCPPSICKETLFGCCQDGFTPAEGNDFEGCPVETTTFIADCSSSEFGCCPDGILAANGPDMEGCASCNETEFGCCPDGISAATGPEWFGCEMDELSTTTEIAENITSECENTTYGCCDDGITEALGPDFLGCACSQSEFGCCPDGNTTATGPNNAGCPAACTGGEFGCCDDNVTLAHGPNKEGCCLLTSYGCCPDNILSARGPNFEGCGCQWSPYGCCPDNQTAARGPSNEGCGCQYTTHGCCPNNYTPAAGPDYQGCPCHTFQFGCCPDGVTTAIGPRSQGCGCEDTQFGCCSDGRTPAPNPAIGNCSCAASKYGCCLDGETEAQGEDFEGCDSKPIHRGEYCSLPKQLGECRNLTIKWYFDMEYGGCSRFWYGGCGGNGNRFNNMEECKATCVETTGKDKCFLPKIEGPCKSYYPRWYYDKERKTCSQFIYSGCLGNANRFETFEECDGLCGTQEQLDACDQTVDSGPCSGNYTRWFFDKESQTCSSFDYGGCKGTQNNFLSESACKIKCLQPGKSKAEEICSAKRSSGPCHKFIPMWYFDGRFQRCKQFYYSGCGGNENRFRTRVECESLCLHSQNDFFQKTQTYKPEECSLPREKGTCDDKLPKWYFDYSENKCLPFHYSGCGGNGNNFDSRNECEQACPPRIELDTCSLPFLEGDCQNYTVRYFYDVLRKQCRPFHYGGCGGNNNNFNSELECQQRCDPKSLPEETPVQFTKDMCFLPSEAGSCTDSEIKWFYNSQDGICKQFRYSGCGGNGNRFESKNDCDYSCSDVQDVCALPRVVGPCNGNYRQWHYDQATQSCQVFDYGGCQGNGNRFDSEEECRSRCVKAPVISQPQPVTYQDTCYMPDDPGPCLKQIPAWFYKPETGACHQFMYGGCEGNANRFATEEQCERQCGQFKGQDACYGEREVGQCDSSIQKYYFDIPSQSCFEFTYTGCGGNPNRFSTVEECESICLRKEEVPIPSDEPSASVNQVICNQPIEAGSCSGNYRRWYYEPRKSGCAPFIYTGCAGNLNNFPSFQACNDFCLPTPKEPTSNEIDVDEEKKDHCGEIERRCSLLTGCPYGLEKWVDSAGCSACRCHEPCLTSPPDCPRDHSCRVELITNPGTGLTEYRGVCRPDNKPGECPAQPIAERCDQECRMDSECPGSYKCCPHSCGTVCSAPRSEEPITKEPPHFPDSTAEAPRISDETPSDEVSQEGNFVSFNCIAYGRPTPSVTWYHNNNELDINNSGGGRYRILSNGTLQVIGLVKSDTGSYICRASNGIPPDATRDYRLTVTDGVRRDAAVVGEENTDLVVKMDQPAVLTCYAIGWPRPSVTWWQGSSMLPLNSESLEQRRDNTLLIKRVTLQRLGFYTCQAYNGQGKAASWTVALKVVGPISLLDPNDVTYNQFVLPARVPPITDDRSRQPYPIPPVTPATQPPPPPPPAVPVRANISSASQAIRAGSNTNLTCDVQGDPTPRTQWYKDGIAVVPSDRISVFGNVLMVQNIQPEDSGEYKCIADNGYSTSASYVNINVQGMRIPPNCTDSPFLANCKLIIQARYCNHKFYAKFCCKSCTEAGQLPSDGNYVPSSRKRRFVPSKMFRIPSE